jgi:hypothetical protein
MVLQGQPQTVKHKPRGFLCDTQCAGNLARTNPILGVDQHPESRQPPIKTDMDGCELKVEAIANFRKNGLDPDGMKLTANKESFSYHKSSTFFIYSLSTFE